MKQRYFTNTLISKYIKYLLSQTPLPNYPVINTDDFILEGCYYIYKNIIFKCTKSGYFRGLKHNQMVEDHLYVNEWVLTTDNDYEAKHWVPRDISNPDFTGAWEYLPDEKGIGGLTVTDDVIQYYKKPVAEAQFINYYNFGDDTLNITHKFVSNTSYYDQQTHKYLGEYLRCLRDIYNLDLMSLYNCFNYNFADNVTLSLDKNNQVLQQKSDKFKVILIPIKYNKTYTIALDSSFPILLKSILYDKVLLKNTSGDLFTDLLQEDVRQVASCSFQNPITYSISNIIPDISKGISVEKSKELQDFESRLYLAIQVPNSFNSKLVVLEGDFSNAVNHKTINAEYLQKLSEPNISRIFTSKPSLLETTDPEQCPFSDKLISYLLRYTIDTREYIDDNVSRIEDAIQYSPNPKHFVKGVWDTDLRYNLYKLYLRIKDRPYLDNTDILGFVDKDIEDAAMRGWIKYARLS